MCFPSTQPAGWAACPCPRAAPGWLLRRRNSREGGGAAAPGFPSRGPGGGAEGRPRSRRCAPPSRAAGRRHGPGRPGSDPRTAPSPPPAIPGLLSPRPQVGDGRPPRCRHAAGTGTAQQECPRGRERTEGRQRGVTHPGGSRRSPQQGTALRGTSIAGTWHGRGDVEAH